MELPEVLPNFLPQATLPNSVHTATPHIGMHLRTLFLSEEEKKWSRRGTI